ncbi:hypothetical protein PVK06_025329 [Gossypium arboreum]|uniref:Uncharacterized protein n=1 Tax=Gossypium arboreum TaxID=29729 RepID=A0ABR0PGH1_GOSAR|nr:hypothetical protein PVK06_025329 [Gossypium arboreum]
MSGLWEKKQRKGNEKGSKWSHSPKIRFEGTVEMSKGANEQNASIETRARKGRKQRRSRDMLSTLESRVVHLEESIGEVKETLEVVEACTNELNRMRKQFKEYMEKAFSSNMDVLEALFDTTIGKLTEKNDALGA